MLRIDTNYSTESTRFTVAGTLIGPWVIVLEECWRKVVVERPGSAIMVHLADVTFIDTAGRELLTRMYRQGVMLVPSGLQMKAIVEDIEADVGRILFGAAEGSTISRFYEDSFGPLQSLKTRCSSLR